MKVCVTGGAGMIGSSLVKRLVQNNISVIVIDNLWRGKLENLIDKGKYVIDINNEFYNIDISNINNVNKVAIIIAQCDTVIHLADIVAGIGYVFNNQYHIFRQNLLINMNLFKASVDAKISKLIYVGTACSFPLELQNSLESELKENQLFPANPESAYGWSKLIGQLELKYLREAHDIDVTTLMLHNVYGVNCEFEGERTQVIPSLINKVINAKEGDILEVWGSGNQGRAFINVSDVVDALIKTIETDNLPEYIQIGPNYCTSIKELINELISISGKDLSIHFDITKPEGDKGRFADFSLAKEYLKWEPKISFNAGLKETYSWIKSQKGRMGPS
jgi:GDP-D-mannose 3', 5'-epimerase